jgi:hypothetical protein
MNEMDPFEERLKRQPLRPVPASWREEILSAAKKAQPFAQSAATHGEPFFWALNRRLASWLWPHPLAWGGLAAIWIFIFALNYSMRDQSPVIAKRTSLSSPEVIAELRQQQQMLAELIGPNDVKEADRPKLFVPSPRSERLDILAA